MIRSSGGIGFGGIYDLHLKSLANRVNAIDPYGIFRYSIHQRRSDVSLHLGSPNDRQIEAC